MANKAQHIFELSQKAVRELSDVNSWTAFLRSAAWQYKYPFEDQLLIYMHSVQTQRLVRVLMCGMKSFTAG